MRARNWLRRFYISMAVVYIQLHKEQYVLDLFSSRFKFLLNLFILYVQSMYVTSECDNIGVL